MDEPEKQEWRPARPTWSPQAIAASVVGLAVGLVVVGTVAILILVFLMWALG